MASANRLRFVVPVGTVHSGPNPCHCGQKRRMTLYKLASEATTKLAGGASWCRSTAAKTAVSLPASCFLASGANRGTAAKKAKRTNSGRSA